MPSSRGILPTQGSNLGLPHCRWILYCLSEQGSPVFQVPIYNSSALSEFSNAIDICASAQMLRRLLLPVSFSTDNLAPPWGPWACRTRVTWGLPPPLEALGLQLPGPARRGAGSLGDGVLSPRGPKRTLFFSRGGRSIFQAQCPGPAPRTGAPSRVPRLPCCPASAVARETQRHWNSRSLRGICLCSLEACRLPLCVWRPAVSRATSPWAFRLPVAGQGPVLRRRRPSPRGPRPRRAIAVSHVRSPALAAPVFPMISCSCLFSTLWFSSLYLPIFLFPSLNFKSLYYYFESPIVFFAFRRLPLL